MAYRERDTYTGEQRCDECGRWRYPDELSYGLCEYCNARAQAQIEDPDPIRPLKPHEVGSLEQAKTS